MGKRRSLKPGGKDEPSDDEDDYEEIEQEPLNSEQIHMIQSRKKLTARRRVNEPSTPAANPFSAFGGFKGLAGTNGSNNTATSITTVTKPILPTFPTPSTTTANTTQSSSSESESGGGSNINETEVKFIQELNRLYEKYYGGTTKREYKIPSHLVDKTETNKTNYAHLLMELNKRCSKWISKHIEESPFVYLTPIFIDYFNYLIQLEKEFFPTTNLFTKNNNNNENGVHTAPAKVPSSSSSMFNGTTPVVAVVEDVSTSMKFPSTIGSTFKFAPIPLTPTTKSVPATESVPAATTASTKTNSFFGTSSQLSSTTTTLTFGQQQQSQIKFGSSNDTGAAVAPFSSYKPPALATSQTSMFTPSTTATASSSFFSNTTPSTELNKKETEVVKPATPATSSPFSFGGNKEITFPKITPPPTAASIPSSASLFSSSTVTPAAAAPTTTTSPPSNGSNLFSFLSSNQQTAAPTSTSTASSGGGGAFFTNLNKPADSTKPFSFGNLTPATSIFGGVATGGFTGFGQPSSGGGLFSQSATASASTEGGGGGGEGGDDNEPYEPPKPEVKEIVEEGALYTKRMKLYYFNTESNQYADRGIGNLHIKLTSDGSKKQMIIRADTSLGNILLNVALNKQIPISKANKNSILIVCAANPPIPKHDEKQPCKFLIKVKTEQDADELFEKLKEMKA